MATFAADTAAVAAGAGVRTFLSVGRCHADHRVRGAPLGAAAGVMITASHNPAPDNGYKVYAADGAQVIPPDDAEIDTLAGELGRARRRRNRPQPPGRRTSTSRAARALHRNRRPALVDPAGPRHARAVYTPLHGVGGAVLPDLLVAAGFDRPCPCPAQADPDPAFPTVAFPNPEEPGALDLAVAERAGSRPTWCSRTIPTQTAWRSPFADRAAAVPGAHRATSSAPSSPITC